MALNSLGGALCIKGEIDRAIDAYERLCNLRLADGKLFPEAKVAKERLKKLRKWKDKLDNCRSQAERHPIPGQYHLKMGCDRFGGGDNHSARLHFERALALGLESKEQAECWFHLGRTRARLKQHAQAIQAFRASLELAEGSTVLYASLGHSLHEAGASFDEIKTTFERAFEKDEDNPWAHSWYALVLKDNGDLEVAERHARKAVDIEPNNSVLLTNLGQVLMAYDDWAKLEEAVTILESELTQPF
jgi:tetratricopeptide (TPR) repeat protein